MFSNIQGNEKPTENVLCEGEMRKGKKIILFLLLFISQLIILAIINACGQLVYATNDDTTMVSLACGAYGEPSEYIVNMHIWVGYILKFLFTNLNFLFIIHTGHKKRKVLKPL